MHAIVLVSHLHRPTMRALAYARASRPQVLEAVTVGVDPEDVVALREQWEALNIPVPLRVLDSPFREITRPVLTYVRSIRRDSPRDLVVVYIPEYVVGHWWEQLLHNQSALRLKGRLLFTPGVVVASVPWQLRLVRGPDGARGPGPGYRSAWLLRLPATARASSSSSRSGRWPTAGTAWPGTTGASSSSGTRCRASASVPG